MFKNDFSDVGLPKKKKLKRKIEFDMMEIPNLFPLKFTFLFFILFFLLFNNCSQHVLLKSLLLLLL